MKQLRKALVLILALMIVSGVFAVSAENTKDIPGSMFFSDSYDIDCDGKIDSNDLMFLRMVILNDSGFDDRFDVNGDSCIDINDYIALKYYIADKPISVLPAYATYEMECQDNTIAVTFKSNESNLSAVIVTLNFESPVKIKKIPVEQNGMFVTTNHFDGNNNTFPSIPVGSITVLVETADTANANKLSFKIILENPLDESQITIGRIESNVIFAASSSCQHEYDNDCDAICNNCGHERTVGAHIYDNDCDAVCNICGYIRAVKPHPYETVWSSDSAVHWRECSVCGNKTNIAEHIYDNDCDAVCNICGYIRAVKPHPYETVWSKNNAVHWHECSVCGDKKDVAEHIYDNSCDTDCNICHKVRAITHDYVVTVVKPTCTSVGYTVHICNVCGYSYKDNYTDMLSHTYDNDCDTDCNVCKQLRTVTHKFDKWECNGFGHRLICSLCGKSINDFSEHIFNSLNETQCNICGYHRNDAPLNPIIENYTDTTVTIVEHENTEYSIDGITWQSSGYFKDLSPATEYTIYSRCAATDTEIASAASNITFITAPVIQNPIQSLDIGNISIFEGVDRSYYEDYDEDGNAQPFYKYNYLNSFLKFFTVTLNDGTIIEPDITSIFSYRDIWLSFSVDGVDYWLYINDGQSFKNQWTLGNNYTVKGSLYYYQFDTVPFATDTFTVTIAENPVESIEIKDISIIEFSNGYYTEDYDEESQPHQFYRYSYNPYYIIRLKNGKTIESNNYLVTIDGQEYYVYYFEKEPQTYNTPWTAGNSYELNGSFFGINYTFTVTITESPIESIEIKDISIVEYSSGYYAEDYDEQWQPQQFYRYYCDPSFIVTLKNGGQIESNGSGIYINGEHYWLAVNDNQRYNNQWTVGNTYEVTGSLMGSSDTFTVTITESPIESIEIKDIGIVEYSSGWQEDGFFYYCNFYPEFSVTMKNGETFSGNGNNIEINGEWYPLNIDTFIQYNEHWTAGNTYTVSGSVLGVKDTFNVTITESPIKSIEIDDVTVDVFNGSYVPFSDDSGNYNFHYNYQPHFSVVLNDGRVVESDRAYIQIDGVEYWLSLDDNQYENPWISGKSYEIIGSLMGKSDTFTVTVADNPIESVEIEDVTVYEGIDGHYGYTYYDGEIVFYYYIDPSYKITMKDGKTYHSKDEHSIIIGEKEYFASVYGPEINISQDSNYFKVGNTYEITGYIFDLTDTFTVTVEENPIKKIAFKKYPKNEYLYGEIFDLYGAQLRVSYKDGTYEDIDFNEHTNPLGANWIVLDRFDDKIVYGVSIDCDEEVAKIEFSGKTATMDVFISPNLTEKLLLSENEYKQPVITVYNSDGLDYNMTVNYLCVGAGNDNPYSEVGVMYTNKGNFYYTYEEDIDGNCRFGLQNPNGDGYIYSNRIPKLQWMQIEKHIMFDASNIICFCKNGISYNGTITKENIDAIIEFSLIRSGCYKEEIIGDTVREAVSEVFGKELDLSLSENYCAETDTYRLNVYGLGEYWDLVYEIKYANGVWKAVAKCPNDLNNQYETVHCEYDDNLKIKSFRICENHIIGDGNDDGEINSQDLIVLRQALLTDTEYSEVLDADGDGIVDIRDLVRMKKYLVDNTTPLGKQNIPLENLQTVPKAAILPENKQVA